MALNLEPAGPGYDQATQGRNNRKLETEAKKNIQIDTALDRLLFKSPDGHLFYLSVSNAGAAVWTAA